MKLSNVTKPKPLQRDDITEYSDTQLGLLFRSLIIEEKDPYYVQKEINYRQNLVEKTDNSALPEQELSVVKKNIKDGAKDTTQLWANALELVHKAYDIAQIQRPDITMESAWKQYEDCIQTAVQELAKARGVDGDWRRTSVSEAIEKPDGEFDEYTIESDVDGLPARVVKKADTIDELIKPFYDHNVTGCDIEMKHKSKYHVVLYFCDENGRTGDKVTIRKIIK